MPDDCIVKNTLEHLEAALASGRIGDAWSQQRVFEITNLVRDISQGRGGPEHIDAVKEIAGTIIAGSIDRACLSTADYVEKALEDHGEVFVQHIQTLHCESGACEKLTPSPCQMACPAGIDIPGYVTLIGRGEYEAAIELIRKDNPFPWVCGLVCTNPCELMCVRGRIDKPVAIKYLKGFVAEQALVGHQYRNPETAPANGRKVCVVGAGPAGLTAAYFLALKGYGVTIIEELAMAGGMMMVGIPRYRLPAEVIEREVKMLEDIGVTFRFNTRLGRDTSVEQLRNDEGFDAVFIAIGAHACTKMKIPGEMELTPVMSAIRFLRNVVLGDRTLPGKKVAVVGGGNVAMDAARTALRLGALEVTVIYRRTRDEMPANIEEVEQAEEEGVKFSFLTVPAEIIGGEDGRVRSMACLETELGPPDDSGRRRPQVVEDSRYELDVDFVIRAIGQRVRSECTESLCDLDWTGRGTLAVNTICMATSMEGVFAAGDMVTGPATVVEAIGGGRKAADAIDRHLRGLPQPAMPPVPVRRTRLDPIETTADEKMSLERPEIPLLNALRRKTTFQQVELGLSESDAVAEAKRCLRCDICIRCGRCVEICRDKMKVNALEFGYLKFNSREPTDLRVTADRCILCGACAANCPTGAMQIRDVDGFRELAICGTVLNRKKLELCEQCGKTLGTSEYLEYIKNKTSGIAEAGGKLCDDCSRGSSAAKHSDSMMPED